MAATLDAVIQRNAENTERIMKNATGYVVANNALGIAAASTLDATSSTGIIKLVGGLLVTASRSGIRDIDPTNELCYLRVKTRKLEYLVAPEEAFTIVVVQ